MSQVAVCDERGRITLGTEAVKKFGKRFHVVVTPQEIVLVPIPKDPLKVLQEEGKKIPKHLSLQDLKQVAEEQAGNEALGNVKRLRRR